MSAITSFSREHAFLSNFYAASVFYEGRAFPSVEHAYQAAKAPPDMREPFTRGSPGNAKRMGQRFRIKTDVWDQYKYRIMLDLVHQKFMHPTLRAMLLATGDCMLVEGNTWGDVYWGVCGGVGDNKLGEILMIVRQELREP